MEFVPAQSFSLLKQHRTGERYRLPVPERQRVGETCTRIQHSAHRYTVEVSAQVGQPCALGMNGAHHLANLLAQSRIGG
ncbi:Uncharacterised protein [Mycobacteroides abscessus subsp. abscessus]|nr:Uncharacterised protein [Mycobacteroides abscessus subsp. abscessus]